MEVRASIQDETDFASWLFLCCASVSESISIFFWYMSLVLEAHRVRGRRRLQPRRTKTMQQDNEPASYDFSRRQQTACPAA